ncbi:MAG: LD-carboxypeptidase [Deltaproteobacteria bacterium]|nr:LD-carboxypeptidase [Deltaproteobacteria bacterium]
MAKQALKGAALQPGQTIGVIAPSAPAAKERLEAGLEYIRQQGFKVRVELDPAANYGSSKYMFSSDSAKARARGLHALYKDKSVRAIISARGAYGSMEILPLLDFKLLKKNPKPFIGFSDSTALLLSIYSKAGMVTVHGPSVESMGKAFENPKARANAEALFELLRGETRNTMTDFETYRFIRKGDIKAPLLVGNLSIFTALMGTPYEPDFSGHIICFEESDERPFRIHRALLQMKLAGKFKRVKAVVLGSFKNCVHAKGLGPTVEDVFRDIFQDQKFPVVSAAPFGHDEDNRALPLGVRARLSGNKLELLELPVLD